MPHVEVWVHCVWATKNRAPTILPEAKKILCNHIYEEAIKKNIFIDQINGYHEHLHCLVSLGNDQSISKVAQLLKGESSFWANKNNLCKERLEWQDDYFAVSVSESSVDAVRQYIKNQEHHHRNKTFQQEYDEFITRYKFG